jgi:hypothetical protein
MARISNGLIFAFHTRGGDRKMSDKVVDLMLRNLREVFNERDAARRTVAVKLIYAKEAEFFEGDERIKGHDANQHEGGCTAGLVSPRLYVFSYERASAQP